MTPRFYVGRPAEAFTGILNGSLSPNVIGQKVGTIQKNDIFYGFFLFFAACSVFRRPSFSEKAFCLLFFLFFADCPF